MVGETGNVKFSVAQEVEGMVRHIKSAQRPRASQNALRFRDSAGEVLLPVLLTLLEISPLGYSPKRAQEHSPRRSG